MTNNGPEASLLPELTGEQVAKSIADELEEQERPDTSHGVSSDQETHSNSASVRGC